ncbi:MAG TPA: MFS transporter [Ktedonobacteraceae bacterium]|nr:MFS transporter [Ktedonobacteraceae bacterium]
MHHQTLLSSRRLLFFTLYLTYVSTGIISILPGPTLPLLAQHTHVSITIAGWIFTASGLGFALGVIVTGLLAGKVQPKSLVLVGLILLGSTAIITPWTHQFVILLLSQLLKSFGFGFLDVSINILMSLAFQDTLSESLNSLHSSYGIGALIAPALLSLTLALTHNPAWAYTTGTVLAVICIILLARQRTPTLAARTKTAQPVAAVPRHIFRQLLLWLMVFEFFFYIAAEIGFSNWIVTAVSQSAAISLAFAAPVATAFWLGLTVSRLASAQVIKRAILSENQVLFICIIGGGISGLLVAIFPGQLAISYGASALFGFFLGPLFPGMIAIASRWFVNTLNTISSALLLSTGISGMIFPAMMGLLIPVIGFNWVMTIPALGCLLVGIPFSLAIIKQRSTLQLRHEEHTIKETSHLSTPG